MPCFDQNIKKIKRQIKTTTQNVRILCMQYHTCYKMFLYDHQFFTYIKQGWNFIKNKTVARWFPENFAKFLRMSFFTEHFQWLLLQRFGLSMKIQNETCHIGFVYCTSMALWQSYIYIYIYTYKAIAKWGYILFGRVILISHDSYKIFCFICAR